MARKRGQVVMSESNQEDTGVMRAKGVNGVLIFDGSWLTIDRSKGFLARTSVGKGEKKIALTQITSVRWKQPSALVRGYISFSLAGGNETRSRFGKQTTDAAKDENAVIVAHTQADEFLAIKAKIEETLAQHHAPAPASPSAAAADDPAEQLKKLADLHQSGLLTNEEFASKRAAIVDRL
jgi:Domain of unknown function (DUF4429)/Short C-terminal domain